MPIEGVRERIVLIRTERVSDFRINLKEFVVFPKTVFVSIVSDLKGVFGWRYPLTILHSITSALFILYKGFEWVATSRTIFDPSWFNKLKLFLFFYGQNSRLFSELCPMSDSILDWFNSLFSFIEDRKVEKLLDFFLVNQFNSLLKSKVLKVHWVIK